ncbi:fatty acyl- reductase 1 [Lasius niger]|uniref:Fatty acyl-CoA reductase n=1 Tax=Lasius niger TaxID=67767 RepID=A0A0J7K904_LASNI|nr:fatty acyl- reductase 1 [Lasius niger]
MLNLPLFDKLREKQPSNFKKLIPVSGDISQENLVLSSLKDPIPGWIDNFNGPMGLFVVAGKGLLRVLVASNYISQNDIPVDTVINTIILVTWKLGLTTYDHQRISNCIKLMKVILI